MLKNWQKSVQLQKFCLFLQVKTAIQTFIFILLASLTGNKKTPSVVLKGFFVIKSLTMTYFHGCPSTIIGAKAFHCPVR
ncbi:hypothetical protein KU392_09775, partial [Advenella alkanexedens]